jgi:hypothetical protein
MQEDLSARISEYFIFQTTDRIYLKFSYWVAGVALLLGDSKAGALHKVHTEFILFKKRIHHGPCGSLDG